MLKTILTISGKPGLYKLVSQGKNMLIVESLADKKRFPAYGNEKITSLGDIAMYTDTEDVPLKEVFLSMKKKGKRCCRSDGFEESYCRRLACLPGRGVAYLRPRPRISVRHQETDCLV